MARKKKDAATDAAPEAKAHNSLLAGLKFVKCAQTEIGEPYKRHCVLYDGWLYAFDGVLSAGVKIDDHAQLAPHTEQLLAALERCKPADASDTIRLTHVTQGLEVRCGRLKAVIPCLPLADMVPIVPDPMQGAVDDRLRKALAACAPLVTDSGTLVLTSGVRIAPGVAVATNRQVVIEAYHGLDVPSVMIPKSSIKEILRVEKPLVGIGCSENLASITFYFNDESWIKTQLYPEEFPSYQAMLAFPSDQTPVPEGFAEGLKTISPFLTDRHVYTLEHQLSATRDGSGTTVDVDDIPGGHAFNCDYLMMIAPIAKTISFGVVPTPETPSAVGGNHLLRFFGEDVRGAVAPYNPQTNDGT